MSKITADELSAIRQFFRRTSSDFVVADRARLIVPMLIREIERLRLRECAQSVDLVDVKEEIDQKKGDE